jgi:hypothetical protein
MKNYYVIKISYLSKPGGWHIVKSESEEDALRIREKYGISYPMHATDIYKIKCEKMDMDLEYNRETIEKRKKHFGGSIWYEEDGNLKQEKA